MCRLDGNSGQILPYYTRQEIDGGGALAGRGLELVYLDDYVDAFLFSRPRAADLSACRKGTFSNWIMPVRMAGPIARLVACWSMRDISTSPDYPCPR